MNRLKTFSIRKDSYFQLFVLIELFAVSLFIIYNYFRHGNPLNSIMLNSPCQFNDYFMHIGYASAPIGTNIYKFSSNACFPPLAYIMYGLLARMVGYSAVDPTDIPAHKLVGNNLTIFLVFTIICIIFMLYAISLYIREKGLISQVVFPCLLMVSYPFAMSSLQRGNSVLLVAILISIALNWRNDESKIKRELALFLIAICAGLKIYPAIFGLMYLKEKRFSEAIRLLLYGILLFFLPFIFFGGIDGLQSFINTVISLNGEIHRCSISGFVNMLMEKVLGFSFNQFTLFAQYAFLFLSILSFFLCKNKWGEVLILCSVMTVYVSSGYMYTCVYMLPSILMFLSDENNKSVKVDKKSWIRFLCFIMYIVVFSIPYKLGYIFIYDTIIIISTIYMINTMITFLLNQHQKEDTIR